MLEWEHETLFENDDLNRVVTRKDRMYYQYGDWSEAQARYVNGQVISTFLCRDEESECLRLAYGHHHRRSGLVSTAKLCRNINKNAATTMGIEYSEFNLVTNKEEHKEESVTKLEERILAHCLLLPYVIPNKKFEAKFEVVYADWDVGLLNNPKQQMSPCATAMMS